MMVLKGTVIPPFSFMPKGHFERSPEHRANIAKAMRGRVLTPEWKERISRGKTGTIRSEESRKKQSATTKGRPSGRVWSDELSATMTAAKLGKCGRLKQYGISNEEYRQRIDDGEKWCGHKKHFAPKDLFHDKSSVCKDCLPEYTREMNLTRLFGVNHEWYLSKLDEQNGACAICGTQEKKDSSGGKHFGVDHCHTTGAIRGLLCFRCNAALERLDEVPNWCIYATAYIEKYAKLEPYIPPKRKHATKYIQTKKPNCQPAADMPDSEPHSTVVS